MRKNKILLTVSLALTVALALGSCDRKIVYYHYEHAPLAGWEKNDTITFDVAPLAEGSYRQDLGLRIDGSYPFMSLCLVVKQTILPSGYVHSDTLNCSLVDRKGKVKGQGISYYQYLMHFNTLKLREGDSLHICVKHNMKREIMPGIADVGIRLTQQ